MTLPIFENKSIKLNAIQRSAIVGFHELVYEGKIKIRTLEKCFCGSESFQILSRCDRFCLPFGTRICKSCGLISQAVQIHPDSMPLFYEKIYWPLIIGKTARESSKDAFVTTPKQDETSSFVLRCVDSTKKQLRIVEVGCGSGIRIKRLKDELIHRGHDVKAFGCDYSSDALMQAKLKEIEVVDGGFDEVKSFGKADILILSHVFEHLPDLELALEQINSLIHDDSLLYIEVPGVVDLENKFEYDFNYQVYCVLAHTYNFSLQSLVNVMAQGGFRLLEGDEYVRSVFVKGVPDNQTVSAYATTILALERAYKKSAKLEARRNQAVYKYLKNLAKALLGRESM
jgi:SAM-dependent methyltransferase